MPGKKIKRFLLWIAAFVVVVAALWLGSILTDWPKGVSDRINPFAPRITSNSEALLTEIRDVLQLRTVEYIYKTVFPYDYIPSDLDWRELVTRRQEGRRLSPTESVFLDRYDFCLEVGIDLLSAKRPFVVVTTTVFGGYDLDGLSENPRWVEARDDELIITLPESTILEVLVTDSRSEDYGYPDVNMSPQNWKRVIDFVQAHVVEEVIGDGILDAAEINGEESLRRIFLDAGWSQISFGKRAGDT